MKGLGIAIGVIAVVALIWFVATQTDTEVSQGDDNVTATTTVDTDYSNDVNRAEAEFQAAYDAVEADVDAGADASVEGLVAFVDSVEAAANAAGDEAQVAFAGFISNARVQIQSLEQQMAETEESMEVEADAAATTTVE